MDIAATVGAIIAVVTLLVGLMKLIAGQVESKLTARDVEQEKRIDNMAAAVEATAKQISLTRTELHRDYVHRDTLTEFQRSLHEDMARIFDQISGVSKDLNQLIGRVAALADRAGGGNPDG